MVTESEWKREDQLYSERELRRNLLVTTLLAVTVLGLLHSISLQARVVSTDPHLQSC